MLNFPLLIRQILRYKHACRRGSLVNSSRRRLWHIHLHWWRVKTLPAEFWKLDQHQPNCLGTGTFHLILSTQCKFLGTSVLIQILDADRHHLWCNGAGNYFFRLISMPFLQLIAMLHISHLVVHRTSSVWWSRTVAFTGMLKTKHVLLLLNIQTIPRSWLL